MNVLRYPLNDNLFLHGSVVAVLFDKYGNVKDHRHVKNIVTDAGDLYYAERGALLTTGTPISPVPTNFTDTNGVPDMIMSLFDGASAATDKANDYSDLVGLVTGSAKAMDSGYPKVNDGDSDNTGAGVDVVTYLVSYLTSEANSATIDDVILTNPSPGGSEPILMHADGLSVAKTSSDTLKVFVNHTMLGV